MTPNPQVLVNALPLRLKPRRSRSKTPLELAEEAFEAACYSSSSGVVISHKNGTGEVLVAESFEDSGLHFIFSKSTNIQYPTSFDDIGVGSVVQVYWTRSFERVVKTAHIVIQIEKMEVYKCATLLRDRIFVTFNSHMVPGVALGVSERNTTVAFHPNCAPKLSKETLEAHAEGRTEFEMKSKHRENTNRMVEVFLVLVPFRVEIAGNVDKIPFVVIRKIANTRGREGVAVITKIIKNHFMEANFLKSSERVYFNSQACHSNILEKVTIGSLINVCASPAFPTSHYRWYGYDVTLCKNYLANADTQRSFSMRRNKILQNYDENDQDGHPMKNAKEAFANITSAVQPEEEEVPQKKIKNLFKFHSSQAQFKIRRLILDRNFCLMNPREANEIVDSYFVDRMDAPDEKENRQMRRVEREESYLRQQRELEENEDMQTTLPVYSESLAEEIHGVLESFNLNKPRIAAQQPPPPNVPYFMLPPPATVPQTRKRGNELPPPLSVEEVRARFGSLMDADGYALNQKVQPEFVIPDTNWKPTERRWIGIHDDVQWVMMATFLPPPPENCTEKKLLGGWWYRRSVPREHPVGTVERMETRRNVIKDCTVSMLIE
ncbi:hypothetical protein B9Z55_008198 [Caenorhabditis nigoni]|uniref:Uncharacterized protein n=1 Tax=Caenorhabditis nigoni TaxID=1611254 RepID=A0A2G5VD15_9PELO|nr:hypothetical protein B9Z55_008198 [Caenorhabditis nigoni]